MGQGASLLTSVGQGDKISIVPTGIFIKTKSEQTNEVSVQQDRAVLEPRGSPTITPLLHQHRSSSCWLYHRSLEKAGVERGGVSLPWREGRLLLQRWVSH